MASTLHAQDTRSSEPVYNPAPLQTGRSTDKLPQKGKPSVSARPAARSNQGSQPAADKSDPLTDIQAEEMGGRPDRELLLQGDVEILRDETEVKADQVFYDVVEDAVDAKGNVKIRLEGDHYEGSALRLKLDTGVGVMQSPVYRLLRMKAHGTAERIDFKEDDVATLVGGTFTTCQGPDPDWYMKSGTLTLDNEREIGTASNAVLMFKGVPIVATPHLSFPLTDARTSGFLAPIVASSSTGGLEITSPYYLNIAPNRDLMLYPRYISRRGLQMGADARYVGQDYAGQTRLEFLENDTQTNTQRYALSAQHQQALAPGLNFSANLNLASDDDYSRDFPMSRTAARRRLLPRDLQLNYADARSDAVVRLTEYQVLQDSRAQITLPYARLPQITYNLFGYEDSGINWKVDSEVTRFAHPTAVQGDRFVINPRVSFPWNKPGYFVRPSLSVHATTYSLDHAALPTMTAQSRVLPTFSIDSGLVLERDTRFFGRSAVQTLEPRLFYSYTPYVEQNSLLYPTFDSAEADFNYAQVFRENRFVGNDRIGDANQITAALSSRFIEDNGVERIRVAVAQRFYFEDQRVTLGPVLPPSLANTLSDVLLLASGRLSKSLRLDTNIQYNQTRKEINRVNIGTYWQPAPMKVLNFQYRMDRRDTDPASRTNFELVDVSGQWPLSDRWFGVGRLNYLINEDRVGQSLLGFEYKADCWIFRAVGQRIPTAFGTATTRLFMQLEFSGLSGQSPKPIRILPLNVPGYQPVTQEYQEY